jgi:hypothetical protein
MDDPQQQRLFLEDAGEISPAEDRLYLGTSGWSYEDWEGTVYPPGTPPAEGPPDVGKIVAALEQHGVEVVGPPGPPQ